MHLVHELNAGAKGWAGLVKVAIKMQQNWGLNGLGQLTDEELTQELDKAIDEISRAKVTKAAQGTADIYLTDADMWEEYAQDLLEETHARRILRRQFKPLHTLEV